MKFRKKFIYLLIIFFVASIFFHNSKIVKSQELTNNPPSYINKPTEIPGSFIIEFYEDPKIITNPITSEDILSNNQLSTENGVKFTTASDKSLEVVNSLNTLNAKSANPITKDNKIYSINIPKTVSINSVNENLKKDKNVKFIEPNYLYYISYFPNDPYFKKEGPTNYFQWNLVAIKAPEAWNITKGSRNVIVAVLDTGIARNAPEFQGVNILQGKRFSWKSDDSGLLINDNPIDELGHGTHVSATIIQKMDNNSHATGIAPNVTLLPVKANNERNPGNFTSTALIAALDYIKTQNAHVVNMSLGGGFMGRPFENKIQELINSGITIVAATGNGADRNYQLRVGYPAALPGVIAVGASRFDNIRSNYSQYGAPTYGELGEHGVTVMAPGGQYITDDETNFQDQNNDNLPDGILQQTIDINNPGSFTNIKNPEGSCGSISPKICTKGCRINDSCGLLQGTSMASPHVAAVVALMKSVNISLTPSQIQDILTRTANKSIPNYNAEEHGAGLVDTYRAVCESNPTLCTPCTPHPNGDANGDQKANLSDFELWRIRDPKANFNCTDGVNIADFTIWKQNFR